MGTEKVNSAGCWMSRFKRVDVPPRQIRVASLRRDNATKTVPQTDTGGRDENSKALERTQEKELGKLTP